jgi:hypothetical protein
MISMAKLASIHDLSLYRDNLLASGLLAPGKNMIKICCGTGCSASGSHEVVNALEDSLNTDSHIEIIKTGCQGLNRMGISIRRLNLITYQRSSPHLPQDNRRENFFFESHLSSPRPRKWKMSLSIKNR